MKVSEGVQRDEPKYAENDSVVIPSHVRDRLKISRAEADEVKKCFTQFSYQAIAFCLLLFGLIVNTIVGHPYSGMAGLLMTYLLLMAARIGNYKYATANRNFAYELHLSRSLDYEKTGARQSTVQILELGWEEAMFAWRIVQATLFDAIYERTRFSRAFREKSVFTQLDYRWWDTDSLKGEASHHPGSYLRYMQKFLHCLAILALAPALYSSMHYGLIADDANRWLAGGMLALTIVVFVDATLQIRRNNAHRRNLENGLLSIQASAVVWRCAALAHFRALDENGKYEGYTKALGKQALEIAKNIKNVHTWMEQAGCFPNHVFAGVRPLVPNIDRIVTPVVKDLPLNGEELPFTKDT